jgi:3-phenylpropionate/trans-cinnamate dioxygenase ferredoxin subunit
MPEIDVAPVDELPPGSVKIVSAGSLRLGVYNLSGKFCAIEDRCSHDDGPLCEGDFDAEEGVVVCPRHGATFDLATGAALTLPAYQPVDVYPVQIVDGVIHVDVG